MSDDQDHSQSVTRYEVSGIEERHGIIPAWLVLVYVVLLIWMVWYLIVFWTDKA